MTQEQYDEMNDIILQQQEEERNEILSAAQEYYELEDRSKNSID